MSAQVISVARSPGHTFSKPCVDEIELIAGQGIKDDAHAGSTVKHRSRARKDPLAPNLRQVHLIHGELIDNLVRRGFAVTPGAMGENITTRGIDLPGLATGSLLMIGEDAVIEVTGLRNPCAQLDQLQNGLMSAVLDRDEHGKIIRLAGVMGVVIKGGRVVPGDPIAVRVPHGPIRPLMPV